MDLNFNRIGEKKLGEICVMGMKKIKKVSKRKRKSSMTRRIGTTSKLAEEIGTKRRMGRRLRNGISSPVLQPPTDKTRIYPRGSVAINSDQRG